MYQKVLKLSIKIEIVIEKVYNNVKISYMLHRIICQAERDLKNITKLPPFLQKAQLIKKLLISSVRFARFLVIYRWWKY